MAISEDLSTAERNKIAELISTFSDIFKWNEDDDYGLTDQVEHHIDTGDARPIRQKQYRLPFKVKFEMDKQIEEMKKKEIIRESNSPWCSPVVMVEQEKEDGTKKIRFCVDFRGLNSVTIKDSFPLPRIDETIECLSGAKFFTKLDLASGYWQVPVAEQDKCKTAFTANNNLYEFNVMPFGLCNGPATFQRLMDTILRGLTWEKCLIYIDDILIFASTFDDHLKNIKAVFERIKISQN
jgi:hypothetical protein